MVFEWDYEKNIMIVQDSIKPGQKPTEEQLQMVREAASRPIEFDEDCPEMSPEMLKSLRCAARQRNRIKKAN